MFVNLSVVAKSPTMKLGVPAPMESVHAARCMPVSQGTLDWIKNLLPNMQSSYFRAVAQLRFFHVCTDQYRLIMACMHAGPGSAGGCHLGPLLQFCATLH